MGHRPPNSSCLTLMFEGRISIWILERHKQWHHINHWFSTSKWKMFSLRRKRQGEREQGDEDIFNLTALCMWQTATKGRAELSLNSRDKMGIWESFKKKNKRHLTLNSLLRVVLNWEKEEVFRALLPPEEFFLGSSVLKSTLSWELELLKKVTKKNPSHPVSFNLVSLYCNLGSHS